MTKPTGTQGAKRPEDEREPEEEPGVPPPVPGPGPREPEPDKPASVYVELANG